MPLFLKSRTKVFEIEKKITISFYMCAVWNSTTLILLLKVLPFAGGGFLNIALLSLLPELLKEENPKECLIQLFFMVCGILVMSVLCIF